MRAWLRSVRTELTKTVWPDGLELRTYLRVVLVVTGAVLVLVVVLDAGFGWM